MRVSWKKVRVRLERPQGPWWETQATGVWRWGPYFMGCEALAHRMLGSRGHTLCSDMPAICLASSPVPALAFA